MRIRADHKLEPIGEWTVILSSITAPDIPVSPALDRSGFRTDLFRYHPSRRSRKWILNKEKKNFSCFPNFVISGLKCLFIKCKESTFKILRIQSSWSFSNKEIPQNPDYNILDRSSIQSAIGKDELDSDIAGDLSETHSCWNIIKNSICAAILNLSAASSQKLFWNSL